MRCSKEARQAVSAMKGVIAYCLQKKKVLDDATGQRMVSGIHCDGENVFVEFMATKAVYQKMDGTTFYHYVQSFSPDEDITPQKAHAVAREFAERAWPGHEILVATPCDAGHLHSHFVVNSVGFADGRKLRQSPNTLQTLRRLRDEICAAHGLSVLPVYENSGRDLSAREYRAAVKGESLGKGSQLKAAFAQAAKRRSWKTWILIIVVSILASALGAALSALLCMRWLL